MSHDEPHEVLVRCAEHRDVSVRLLDRQREDQDCVHFAVWARAPGLDARVDKVFAWIWEPELARFLDGLAADFRGWDGERRWQTHDVDLALRAVFGSRGYVSLTWTLRPWRASASGRWEASVTTTLEAGEQLSALAADVRHFLHNDI